MILKTGFLIIILSVFLYGAVHSLLASLEIKEKAQQYFGIYARKYYRFFFIIFAIVSFSPVLLMTALLPDGFIYLIPAPFSYLTILIQLISVIGAAYSLLQTDLRHFLGMRQYRHPDIEEYAFLISTGPYRYVRHPIYFFSLLFLWLTPVMTWNILAFNLSATIYMTVGSIIEEKKLVNAFGQAYIDYQNHTPMLLPIPKRKKQSMS